MHYDITTTRFMTATASHNTSGLVRRQRRRVMAAILCDENVLSHHPKVLPETSATQISSGKFSPARHLPGFLCLFFFSLRGKFPRKPPFVGLTAFMSEVLVKIPLSGKLH